MFKKGERVKHPLMPDWGLGQVLEDCSGDQVKVFFVDGGPRTISLKHVELVKVSDTGAESVLLDNLADSASLEGVTHFSFPTALELFSKEFPQGFYDEKYMEHERNYKIDAHLMMLDQLDRQEFKRLLDNQDFDEIRRRVVRLFSKTNMLSPHDHMNLGDALKEPENQRRFAAELYDFLYSEESIESRFTTFARVLEEMNGGKWTVISFLLFMRYPKEFMFLKPSVTEHVCKVMGFEIGYSPELKWTTYSRLLTLSNELMKRLDPLQPRDMIDVQSFMWVIKPGSYQ